MPEMDGYDTMRAIRADPRFSKLPIITLTAKAMKGDREKCIEAGASDYITKPVDTARLISLAARVAESQAGGGGVNSEAAAASGSAMPRNWRSSCCCWGWSRPMRPIFGSARASSWPRRSTNCWPRAGCRAPRRCCTRPCRTRSLGRQAVAMLEASKLELFGDPAFFQVSQATHHPVAAHLSVRQRVGGPVRRRERPVLHRRFFWRRRDC